MKSKRQSGFTLLEVLVAFAITSLALVLLMQVFSNGLRLSSRVEDYGRVTVLAESLLARMDREFNVNEAPFRGQFDDRFDWFINVTPYPLDEDILEHPSVELTEINIQISWQDGPQERLFELDTLRLLPKDVN